MSFSAAVKNELARIYNTQTCCQKAELAALLRLLGRLSREESNAGETPLLRIATENAAVARKVLSLFSSLAGIRGKVLLRRKTRLHKNMVYSLRIPVQPVVYRLLGELGLTGRNAALPWPLLKKDCCRRAYLRGVFLASGSVSNPEGSYHLELVVGDEAYAAAIRRLMSRLRLTAKNSQRKGKQVIYLKGGEQIIRFLNLVGAHSALLDFENTRIYKGMRGQVNRQVNCDTANLYKSVNASVQQLENIILIKNVLGLEQLPASLREIAELRTEYPEATLKELGSLAKTPLSKSGINYRIRKIEELAENLRLQGLH